METARKMISIFFWLPRIICIFAILFISLFALDAFSPGLTVWQQMSGFLIHLIPSFILTLLLIAVWKRELIGGILFALTGIGTAPFIFINNFKMNKSVGMSLGIMACISLPFLMVGILFMISYIFKKIKIHSI
jgi:hypothetical protein